MAEALLKTHLHLNLLARGKVRDVYELDAFDPASPLLFIATDRISAFDHVLGSGIPDKGRILTQLSLFWFDFLSSAVPSHLITADSARFPLAGAQMRMPDGTISRLRSYALGTDQTQPGTDHTPTELAGRTMLVKRARMFPVECVARGYLSGSGWKDYQADQAICGIPLPAGLRESDRLPEPIFTPAAKINTGGHDENISFDTAVATIGPHYAEALRTLTLELYARASAYALSKGVILADTKFEFGLVADAEGRDQIILCDEALTPDSSRYWPLADYQPGGPVPSFDKQYVRDYLESIRWNKQAPAPSLPDEVIRNTRAKYLEAYQLLTGRTGL